jgi:nucleoside-diphosphate-sugar epimerase
MNQSSEARHVLVIGGAGYVGSPLVRRLLSSGSRVRVLDALTYGHGCTLHDLFDEPRFSFVRGDYGDPALLEKALQGTTDVVLLAALVGDPICKKYPELAKRINEESAKELLERIDGTGVRRFVFVSTCSNYGLRSDSEAATEESELKPLSLYAKAKVAIERHILQICESVSYSPTLLRLATAYGFSKRMRFDLTISQFAREFALGNDLLVYDQETWRPYCHVEDISRAIELVLDASDEKVAGEVFNVGGNDENFTKSMIIETIREHLPEARPRFKEGGFDPRNYRVSFDKIASVLGFRNQYTVPGNIPRVIDAVRSGLFDDYEERKNFYGNYVVDETHLLET